MSSEGVGGSPWRQVYSNGSILDPFVVSVWVENPGNCAPNVLMIQCWWLSEGSNNKLELLRVVSRPANCYRAAVSSSELLVIFHMSGERSAMWRIAETASSRGPTATARLWEGLKTKPSRGPCRGVASQRLRIDVLSLNDYLENTRWAFKSI